MNKQIKLTICTVSFGHQELIELNLQLCRSLNPGFNQVVRWLIADNAHDNPTKRLRISENPLKVIEESNDSSQGASHHHALALNGLINKAETPYVLILDPDFFILQKNWLINTLNYMQLHQLSFFGAPWHPRYNNNYRYFPAVHCMFVDLNQVAPETLDFRPVLDRINAKAPRNSLLDLIPYLRERKRIPWDTGTRIFEHYQEMKNFRRECVTPVFREDRKNHGSMITRILEPLLPEEYCYFPKNLRSYVTHGFNENKECKEQLPSIWEESYWRKKPFGLHVRGSYSSGSRNKQRETELLVDILSELTKTTLTHESNRRQ